MNSKLRNGIWQNAKASVADYSLAKLGPFKQLNWCHLCHQKTWQDSQRRTCGFPGVIATCHHVGLSANRRQWVWPRRWQEATACSFFRWEGWRGRQLEDVSISQRRQKKIKWPRFWGTNGESRGGIDKKRCKEMKHSGFDFICFQVCEGDWMRPMLSLELNASRYTR